MKPVIFAVGVFLGSTAIANANCAFNNTKDILCDSLSPSTDEEAMEVAKSDRINAIQAMYTQNEATFKAKVLDYANFGVFKDVWMGGFSTIYRVVIPGASYSDAWASIYVDFYSRVKDNIASIRVYHARVGAVIFQNGYSGEGLHNYEELLDRGVMGTFKITPVPGPEAGASLGALAVGVAAAIYMKRRRKEEALAA